MGDTRSCLVLLPEFDRARMGLLDPRDPVVMVDFRLEENRFGCFDASTVSDETLRGWLNTATPEHRELIDGRRLCLRLDGNSMSFKEAGVPVEDGNLSQFAEHMFEHMRQQRGLATEVIAHLPSVEDLRTRVETYVRTRIQMAVQDDPKSLDYANWCIQSKCDDHCFPKTDGVDKLVETVISTIEASYRIRQGSPRTFAFPSYVPGRCAEQSSVRNNVVDFLGDATAVLLNEYVPKIYAELAPDRSPALPAVGIPDGHDLADLMFMTMSMGQSKQDTGQK